jgi:hypothetical protein
MPAAPASWVLMNACAATALACSPSPALNPNQPNHKIPAPMTVSGIECGKVCPLGQLRRRPTTSSMATTAVPAEACTTMPPAQSCAPSEASQPPGLHSQCTMGEYTMSVQKATKAIHPPILSRAAVAPVISAGVMMANIIW